MKRTTNGKHMLAMMGMLAATSQPNFMPTASDYEPSGRFGAPGRRKTNRPKFTDEQLDAIELAGKRSRREKRELVKQIRASWVAKGWQP